jgi:hypothetical protein
MVFVGASWTTSTLHLLVRDCGEGLAETAFGGASGGPRVSGRGMCVIAQLSDGVEYLNSGSTISIGFTR